LFLSVDLRGVREGKSKHAFFYPTKPPHAQSDCAFVRRFAVAQPICQQPVYSRHTTVGELDDGGVCLVGAGGVATGET
jgi:hypothetical protein